jgi:4-hydroxy-4-methyl-2-oxoglutarate aldolase
MADDPVLTIRRVERPAPALLDRFRDLPTGVIVDAMGRRGALAPVIGPITARRRFVGTALTVWTTPSDNLAVYAAIAEARPGDVLLVTNGGDATASVVGDLALGMARNAGVVGLVTDCYVRDLDGLERVGVPVFARGLTPNSPFKNGPGEIGGRIAIAGVVTTGGDIVVADVDGVVVVPQPAAEGVLAACATVVAKEREVEAAIAGGMVTPDWLRQALDRGIARRLG